LNRQLRSRVAFVLLSTVAIGHLVSLVPGAGAAVYKFGDDPLDYVYAAASLHWDNESGCPPSAKALAAIMLAPTWIETGAYNQSQDPRPAPAPQAHSRWEDEVPQFWERARPQTFKRRAYNPGIGAWQLDAIEFNMRASEKVSTQVASKFVAQHMEKAYCQRSGSAATKRAAAWSKWACGSWCETWFNAHYKTGSSHCGSAPDCIIGLQRDGAVENYGGMERHWCYAFGDEDHKFRCYLLEPYNGDGYLDKSNVSGCSNCHQLPLPSMYFSFSYQPEGDSNTYEYRFWFDEDTEYSYDIYVRRAKGKNPYNDDVLSWRTRSGTSRWLCDATDNIGACN
jgi:hypothetical protein